MSSNACYNKEVLMDILVRLPPKPLVRFLCASKFLSELISNSIFVTSHFKRNSTRRDNIYLLCLHYPNFTCKDECKDDEDDNHPSEDVEQELQWSLFFNDTFELRTKLSHPFGRTGHFRIYGSSNGVLCISDETLSPKCPIHLWNPAIGKCRTLPLSITDDTKFRYISLQFGFHLQQDDYKVVRMIVLANNTFAVEVYSLSRSSWKLIEDVPVWLKCPWKHHQSTFLNGVAYHVIEKNPILSVISIDPGSEEFEEYILPDAICYPSGLCIDVFKDWICLLLSWYSCEEEDMEKCDLWVLQEKKWKQLAPFVFPSDCYSTIGINIDNELKLKRIDFSMGSENLYFCDYKSRQVRETCIKLAPVMNHDVFAITYIESLVLLNC